MTPRFIMHSGYKSRVVEFVLSRERNGWKFYGRDSNGYLVPAKFLNDQFNPIFATRTRAAEIAKRHGFPVYATWNGRKRAYNGKGAEFLAIARDAAELV